MLALGIKPMKARVEKITTIEPRSSDICMNMGGKTFGNICLNIIFVLLTPPAFAASIYVSSLADRVWLLAYLAERGHHVNANAIDMCQRLLPRMKPTARARMRYGMLNTISVNLITISSHIPPAHAEIIPTIAPTLAPTATTKNEYAKSILMALTIPSSRSIPG